MAEYTIHLNDLTVAMRLGIHPHEQMPQRVLLSVSMTVNYLQAPATDRIDEVLDYDFVREGIQVLASRGFALQETFVDAIAGLCLSDARVRSVRVRSVKLDVYPDATVGCEVIRKPAR